MTVARTVRLNKLRLIIFAAMLAVAGLLAATTQAAFAHTNGPRTFA